MRVVYPILLASLLLITSCDKKGKEPEQEETPQITTPVVPVDSSLKCASLPPAPVPFGWKDTIPEKDKSVAAFLFDPVDGNKILYMVDGDIFGYNKLFFYTIPTKQSQLIGQLGNYLPQVNAKGEIIYSDVTNNIVLVKPDGSLISLVSNNRSHNPVWDPTGKFIYYFSEGIASVAAQVVKINTSGDYVSSFPIATPNFAPLRKTEALIIAENLGSRTYLSLKDLTNSTIGKELISGPIYSAPGQIYFDNLTVDRNDENFYWSNSIGVFRCNIASLKVDTVLKNCPNYTFNNPMISFENELTYSQYVLKPLDAYRLLHLYKAMEMNTVTGKSSEVKLFP